MKSKHFNHLVVFLVQTSLVFARTYPNYGYYNPFPPKNQVLYSYSPMSETRENNLYNVDDEPKTFDHYGRRRNNKNRYNYTVKNSDKKLKSKYGKERETRDLTWRQFDVFLRGDAEPSCAELRKMWNLARKLQKQTLKENTRVSKNHLHSHQTESEKNIHLKKHGKSASDSDINSVAATDKKLAHTNRANLVNRKNNLMSTSLQSSDDKNTVDAVSQPTLRNSTSIHSRDVNDTTPYNEEVYGVIKTHVSLSTPSTPAKVIPSPNSRYNKFRVRDPAKEIFGLFRQRSKNLRNRQRKHRNRKYHYGKVHLETPTTQVDRSSSYLDLLQSKLYGVKLPNKDEESSDNEVYGVVRHHPSSIKSPSSFERAREILAGQRGSLEYEDDLQLNPGESAFDRIREKLMKTRAKDKLNRPKAYLRRLRSRKRRQNVSLLL